MARLWEDRSPLHPFPRHVYSYIIPGDLLAYLLYTYLCIFIHTFVYLCAFTFWSGDTGKNSELRHPAPELIHLRVFKYVERKRVVNIHCKHTLTQSTNRMCASLYTWICPIALYLLEYYWLWVSTCGYYLIGVRLFCERKWVYRNLVISNIVAIFGQYYSWKTEVEKDIFILVSFLSWKGFSGLAFMCWDSF